MAANGAGRRFIEQFLEAWVEQDSELVGRIFSDDIVYYWDPAKQPLVGLPALKDYWNAEGDLQDRIRINCRKPLELDGVAVAELWVRMLYKGTETSDPEAIEKAHSEGAAEEAGHEVAGQLCVIAELQDDGRCREIRQYQVEGGGDPPDWWGGFEISSTR